MQRQMMMPIAEMAILALCLREDDDANFREAQQALVHNLQEPKQPVRQVPCTHEAHHEGICAGRADILGHVQGTSVLQRLSR